MIKKFPNSVSGKWNRYSKLEKVFIIYCIILVISLIFTPIIQTKNANFAIEKSYHIFNTATFITNIILIINLAILLLRNTSYRFKKIVNILVGFKENESLMNFGILFVITVGLLNTFDTVNLMNDFSTKIEIYSINMPFGLFSIPSSLFLGTLLIFGLGLNLFLAINNSKNKKKSQIINISQHKNQEGFHELSEIKGLFE